MPNTFHFMPTPSLILPLAFLLIMTGPGVLSIDRFIFGTGRKLKPVKPTSKPQSK